MAYFAKELAEKFKDIDAALAGSQCVIRRGAPSYIRGDKWTDELRNRNGFYLIDGAWVSEETIEKFWGNLKKDITYIYQKREQQEKELEYLRRKVYTMEYGLRVARKSLEEALNIDKENTDE